MYGNLLLRFKKNVSLPYDIPHPSILLLLRIFLVIPPQKMVGFAVLVLSIPYTWT